jgi:RNA polymerase-associated protein RTF1
MDESDSDSDTSPTAMFDEADKYPVEGRFTSHDDKAAIMALPEIKREEILAERAQEIERDRQSRALRQLLSARDAGNKNKRKAAADLDDSPRKTARQRTKVGGGRVGEASSGIDNLKKARAEKDDRQKRRQEDRDRNKDRSGRVHDDYSDGDVDGDSEVDWDDSKPKRRSPSLDARDAQPADLRDIQRVRVGRANFAQVCFYPGFEAAITGCFVRISIGPNKETGENIYRMGIIKGNRPFCYRRLMLSIYRFFRG